MTQKEKAMECLQQLDICDNFIQWFDEDNYVVLFDLFIGEPLISYPDVVDKIKEVEKQYGCLVYAVTHGCYSFGECYSFLMVSKYEEDWQHCLRRIDNDTFSASAYVWNKTDECCSEFGYISVCCNYGGILRVS